MRNAYMVINLKTSKVKRDDVEYPIWQRSLHSSPRGVIALTWRREAVIVF
jgi:hypothetical protein